METKKSNRTKWLHLRLTPQEHKTIVVHYLQSTCRKLSEYARLQLLRKPVIGRYRNESQEALMIELIALRKELNGFGNNFNQSVKKLHTLTDRKALGEWVIRFETERLLMMSKLEEIKKNIAKIGEAWLQ